MKKLKVLMMGGMLAAGICLFAACGTANDDGTNNGVNDTSNTQVTTQENIPGTDRSLLQAFRSSSELLIFSSHISPFI